MSQDTTTFLPETPPPDLRADAGRLDPCVDSLVSAALATDVTDLPALADLHGRLQHLERDLRTRGSTHQADLAATLVRLVETVALGEASDPAARLAELATRLADLATRLADLKSAPTKHPTLDHSRPPTAPATSAPTSPELPTGSNAGHTPIGAPVASGSVALPDLTESGVSTDDLPLVRDFLAEATEHLATVEAGLLTLERDPRQMETLNAVFRGFHSIKGAAGFLHLRQIAALAHAAEGLLDDARTGRLLLTGPAMEAVLSAVDTAKLLLAGLGPTVESGTAPAPLACLPDVLTELAIARTPPAAPTSAPTDSVHSFSAPQPGTAQVPPTSPSPASETQVDASSVSVASSSPASTSAFAEPSTGRTVPAAPAVVPATATTLAGSPATASAPLVSPGAPAIVAPADTSLKVSTERLDQLINMVGELVIAESMVSRDCAASSASNPRAARNLGHLSKITRELQELSMSLRMVPVQGTFSKMNRLVRDTARKLGKEVELVLEGGETELDRTVVDSLSDPLVHMVRNAVDHGLETPDVRLAAGKPRSGRLLLRARHEAGAVVIEIADDGKGIDAARVLAKARAAGVVSPHQDVSDADAYRLIFHPGLSTADKVTDVSGRGVGMDVVRKNVERMRGRVDITSAPGKGSTFTIRLPLTLAVIDGLTVRVGSQTYVLPLTSVERNLRPTPDQISTAFGRGEMCLLRGDLLPLVRLHNVFGVTPRTTEPTEALVVVVHDDARRVGLLVDDLLGQQQVVIKSLGYGATGTKGVAGGAILGDGTVSLILDVPSLIDLASDTPNAARPQAA